MHALPALTGRTRQFERCSNSRVRPVVGQALSDRSTCRRVGQACPISSWDRLHRTSRDRSDKSVRPVGSRFGRTVSVRTPVEHGCSSTARAAVFDRLMPAVMLTPSISSRFATLVVQKDQEAFNGSQMIFNIDKNIIHVPTDDKVRAAMVA
ncbi:hypothetical protein PCASD_01534 [Puccinia coronata f. sp. avenae]|uniref:Uncharacterized protein n=1 Tax=Puccinia coronata f. sp. avenae TaxID=200324 RepID=A0A2N5VIG3_9BASI|nr:hypothetical protein PCASD_01534 [Puccinia coronata f. sp. avenae]